MVSSRTRGVANTFIITELLIVTACFWAAVLLWEVFISLHANGLNSFLFYNEFLLLGLLLSTQRNQRILALQQHGPPAAARIARRQTLAALFAVFAAALAVRDKDFPREFLFSFAPILFCVLWICNQRLPVWLAHCFFTQAQRTRVLLAGDAHHLGRIQSWLKAKEVLGFEVVGFVSDADYETGGLSLPHVGRLDDLEQAVDRYQIDQVILLELLRRKHLLREFTDICERRGIRLLVVSDLEEHFRHGVHFFEDEGLQLIGLRDEPLEEPVNRFLKRTLDIAISVPVVVLVLPITTALVWALQCWQSPGPLLYRQNRSGLQNRPFRILKYRTMRVNHGEETRQATRNDGRVYPAGGWLRRLSIDELPQFWNVLRGEMSVIGPRPHLTEHNAAFARAMNSYHVRAFVKPGISGLAQIRGYRGETRTDLEIVRRVSADIDYLENWSFSLDCWIILKTVRQLIFPPANAY